MKGRTDVLNMKAIKQIRFTSFNAQIHEIALLSRAYTMCTYNNASPYNNVHK